MFTGQRLDPQTVLTRMRMAYAEIGMDSSGFYLQDNRIICDTVDPVSYWRATQLSDPRMIYCFACWQADNYYPEEGGYCYSCLAPLGILDCGATR